MMLINLVHADIHFVWESGKDLEIPIFEAKLRAIGIAFKNQGASLVVEAKAFTSIEDFEKKLNIKKSNYDKQINTSAPEVIALNKKRQLESGSTHSSEGEVEMQTQEVFNRNKISSRELIKDAINMASWVDVGHQDPSVVKNSVFSVARRQQPTQTPSITRCIIS
jgi:hypothetical protein